jgi:hypothetical protein
MTKHKKIFKTKCNYNLMNFDKKEEKNQLKEECKF